jgi:magnesium-transporting ATPase (P-type)
LSSTNVGKERAILPNSDERRIEAAKKELMKKRIAKMVTNLAMVVIILTITVAALTAIGLTFVAIVVIVGLLPGITAHILDRRKGRAASRTVFAFNVAGLTPQIVTILLSGNPNNTAQQVLSNPFTWLWIYMFAAFGWLTVHLIPQIAYLVLNLKAEFLIKKHEEKQEKLIDEWGEAVTGIVEKQE